jgi:hypothetical protein
VEFVGRIEPIPVVLTHGLLVLVGWIGNADDFDGGTAPPLGNEYVSAVAGWFDFGFVDFVSFDLVPIHYYCLHYVET